MSYSFTTPVGRLVYGSVWEGSDRAKDGTQRITKTGPNAGKPLFTWSFGVAFPKLLANGLPNVEFNEWYKKVHETARGAWPQFMAGPVDPITGLPGPSHPRFAMKIADGDGIDGDGKPNNVKEGWAGHWVVKFSSSAGAPRVFDLNVGLDPTQQLQDKTRVLPGDFVAVQGSCSKNDGDTPGLYMNGNMVCYVGGGPRIVTGPRASDAFGKLNVASLPPGCVVGANPSNVAPPPAVPVPVVGSAPAAGVTAPPVTASVPPVVVDPMARAAADGWIVHPSAAGYRYKGTEVKTDAELATMYAAPAAPAVTAPPPAVPGAPIIPNPSFVAPPPTPAVPVPPVANAAPVITLSPQAIAAGYTDVNTFLNAGFNYDMMKAQGWAL